MLREPMVFGLASNSSLIAQVTSSKVVPVQTGAAFCFGRASLLHSPGVLSNCRLNARRKAAADPKPICVAISLSEALELSNAGANDATYYLFTYIARTPVDMERGRKAGGSVLLDWNDVPKNPNATGFNRASLDRPTAMFRRFEMHVSTVGAGLTNHAPHTHFAEEFLVVREGNVSMFIDGRVIPAATGDVIFNASNVPHSLNNGKESTTEYFAFQGQAR